MKLLLLKQDGRQYDVTAACTSISWRGTAAEAARSLSFSYINAPYDITRTLPTIATGDAVSFSCEPEGEVFFGQIFGIEKSSQTGSITYEAFDLMKHLLESKGQYVFKKTTPEAIAAQVLADVQVPVRYLYPTGVNIESMLCDSMSLYDIIMAAYGKAKAATGDRYFAMIYKRGFGMYRAEWSVKNFVLSDRINIYESSASEHMDEIKNQIKIYDQSGTQVGELKDESSIKMFGVFQDIYRQEGDGDSSTGAKELLKGMPEASLQLSALGDISCLSNYFVQIQDSATGLSGKYWIASDEHVFEGGTHKMRLEVKFDSVMDVKESGHELD